VCSWPYNSALESIDLPPVEEETRITPNLFISNLLGKVLLPSKYFNNKMLLTTATFRQRTWKQSWLISLGLINDDVLSVVEPLFCNGAVLSVMEPLF
jgi:hypothetical protein